MQTIYMVSVPKSSIHHSGLPSAFVKERDAHSSLPFLNVFAIFIQNNPVLELF